MSTPTTDTQTLRQKLEQDFPFLCDPFISEATDISRRTPEERAAFCRYFGLASPERDDGFGSLQPDIIRSSRHEYAEMLNDPEIRKELAERDPTWKGRYEQETIEAIVHQFRLENPKYKPTTRNKYAVFTWLTKKYLNGVDWYNTDEAALKLLQAGHLSTQTLREAYIALRDSGQLRDTPDGEYKALSAEEQIQVIALLRTGHPDRAIDQFMQFALANNRKTYKTVAEFFARNPELASRASLFVWRHMQPDLSDEEFSQFERMALAGEASPDSYIHQ